MDPRLLDYYNRELIYMRDAAGEFAAAHPKVARRLGMRADEIEDPYVERLIESFSFMSARLQLKLDAEFPRFTERLLEVLFPNYVCPTPSMTVLQLHPQHGASDLAAGFRVPAGARFQTRVLAPGMQTPCTFRSSQEVRLWPIDIVDARLTGAPPDLLAAGSRFAPPVQLAGALRLRLRLRDGAAFQDFAGLDRLPVYLCGDEQTASRLFELLHTAAVGLAVGAPGAMARQAHLVTHGAVVHEGLDPGDGLLPLPWNTFHGHNLLHEFFVCPERFWFFTLTRLGAGLARIPGNEAEVVVLLDRAPGDLAPLVDACQFALFCTPAINLFSPSCDKLKLDPAATEQHYQPRHQTPLDFEVHSVQRLTARSSGDSAPLEFRPLYQSLHHDHGDHGRYFSIRRELRLPSDAARIHGTRSPYVGSEVFLSLVDQHEAPYPERLDTLEVQALLTNRDLPCLMPRNGVSDLSPDDDIPVDGVGLIRPATRPRPPHAQQELSWRLIRQLNFNHLPLVGLPEGEGAQALRDMLRLFVSRDDEVQNRLIDSLIGTRIVPVTRRLPGAGPLLYGRGVECTLTVNEDGFSGSSPYLFGLVLERYLARHVSVNAFCQTVLESPQRGTIARWPVRAGGRGVV